VKHFHLAFKGMDTEEVYDVLMEQRQWVISEETVHSRWPQWPPGAWLRSLSSLAGPPWPPRAGSWWTLGSGREEGISTWRRALSLRWCRQRQVPMARLPAPI